MKTIVIGLDGANWSLIEPWIENGDLPNLKYLRENGVWGYQLLNFQQLHAQTGNVILLVKTLQNLASSGGRE